MKVLVAVASRHGSTCEIAAEIGKTLRASLGNDDGDTQVDIVFAENVISLEEYESAIDI